LLESRTLKTYFKDESNNKIIYKDVLKIRLKWEFKKNLVQLIAFYV